MHHTKCFLETFECSFVVKIEELLPSLVIQWFGTEKKLHHAEFLDFATVMLVFSFLFFPPVGENIILRGESYNMQEQLRGKTFALRLLPLLLVR